jgi:hypothetical protein
VGCARFERQADKKAAGDVEAADVAEDALCAADSFCVADRVWAVPCGRFLCAWLVSYGMRLAAGSLVADCVWAVPRG